CSRSARHGAGGAGSACRCNGALCCRRRLILPARERRTHPGVQRRVRGRLGATMEDPQKLRELAAWYREFAEKTGNPSIWESRLRMAEDLEQEADLLERRQQPVEQPVAAE